MQKINAYVSRDKITHLALLQEHELAEEEFRTLCGEQGVGSVEEISLQEVSEISCVDCDKQLKMLKELEQVDEN